MPGRYEADVSRALKLFVVLARASESVGEHARRDIRRHGLSLSEFAVLELLWHKGPQPLGEVASRILLTTGTVTYVIDQLVKQGMVRRRRCPNDRRVVFAELTPAGEERIAAAFPDHARCIASAVSGLSPDEQEAAVALLKKLGLSASAALTGDEAAALKAEQKPEKKPERRPKVEPKQASKVELREESREKSKGNVRE